VQRGAEPRVVRFATGVFSIGANGWQTRLISLRNRRSVAPPATMAVNFPVACAVLAVFAARR